MNKGFKYNLSDYVGLIGSDENGQIIGRSEYVNSEPQYLIRYMAADGRLVEAWWDEDALE